MENLTNHGVSCRIFRRVLKLSDNVAGEISASVQDGVTGSGFTLPLEQLKKWTKCMKQQHSRHCIIREQRTEILERWETMEMNPITFPNDCLERDSSS